MQLKLIKNNKSIPTKIEPQKMFYPDLWSSVFKIDMCDIHKLCKRINSYDVSYDND